MNPNIFNGLPMYVRITILSQIRRLLSTPLFSSEDKEDLAQDLLLFYLKRFYEIPDPDEALVVHSIKQYATNLLTQRYHRRDFLYSSLTDYEVDGEFSFLNSSDNDFDENVLIIEINKMADAKEKKILQMIGDGYSINQIAVQMHIHKRVIRRLFEKLRKNLK